MSRPVRKEMALRRGNGKILLRLPISLHRKAVLLAEKDGTSLNQWLLSAISEAVGKRG